MYLVLCSIWALGLFAAAGLAVIVRGRMPVAIAVVLVFVAGAIVACQVAYPGFGLEYEDAFEYIYNGLLANSGSEGLNSRTTLVVAAGSLDEPRVLASLSHPPGAAAFWALLLRIFGGLAAARAASAAVFAVFGLGSALLAARRGRSTAYAATLLVFLASPFLAFYATTGFAEVPASMLIALALLARSCADESHPRARVLALILLAVVGFLLPITKREMILIPIGLAIESAVRYSKSRCVCDRDAMIAIVVGVALAVGFFRDVLLNVDLVRTSDLAPFSARTLNHLGPLWLKAVLSNWRYGLWGAALIAGIGGAFIVRTDRILALTTVSVLIVSLGFSQSYYYGTTREIPWLHFERYSFVLWPLALILWHANFARLFVRRLQLRRAHICALGVLGIAAVVGVGASAFLASSRYREECRIRFDPIRRAMATLGDDDWVVTPNPILASLIDPQMNVANLTQLDLEEVRSVLLSAGLGAHIRLALSESDSLDSLQRYPLAMAALRDIESRTTRGDSP